MKRGDKRAQVQQVLIYAFLAVVASMIFVFGYRSLSQVEAQSGATDLYVFINKFKADIDAVSTDFGTVKVLKYQLPAGVDEVCFSDSDPVNADPLFGTCGSNCITNIDAQQPIVSNIMSGSGDQNTFLLGSIGPEVFVVEKLRLCCQAYCFKPKGNTISIRIEGQGSYAIAQEG
ncbi:MAG: hypothetical protein ABH879_02120 [archaeon]